MFYSRYFCTFLLTLPTLAGGIRRPKHVGVDLTGPMRTDRVARVRAGFGRAALANSCGPVQICRGSVRRGRSTKFRAGSAVRWTVRTRAR